MGNYVLWMAFTLGVSAILMPEEVQAIIVAPFPACQKQIPESSDYIVMDRPDDRPIMGIMQVNDKGDMVVGTDEAVYLYADHHYTKTLPHMLWEPLFKEGGYIYAVVNPFNRKSMRGQRLLYRTKNGKDWQLIGDRRYSTAKLFAVDAKNDKLYAASPHYSLGSSLSVRDMQSGAVGQIGDKRLRDIEAIEWFQGGLYVTCHRDKLFVSHDEGKTFTDITSHLGNSIEGKTFMLANADYLVVSAAGHYVNVFDGKVWKEIAASSMKRGAFSFYRIHALKDHQLVMSQLSRHVVMDLRTEKRQEIHLPKVYHYSAYSLVNDWLVVSARLAKDNMLTITSGGKNSQDKQSQLLKVRLTPTHAICKAITTQTPYKIIPAYGGWGHGIVIDSGKVYFNNNNKILDIDTQEQVNLSTFAHLRYLKRGAVKGDWFINIAKPKISFRLHRSTDRGKTWQVVPQRRQIPTNAVIDDSLQIVYYLTARTIERIDLRADYETTRQFELIEGTPESLIIDNLSRVWMQTSEGIFVSKASGGWWQCPLPFKDNPKIAIRGFALGKSHMAVTYRDKLYLSRNDTINWKVTPIIDPCSKQSLPVRIVGNSKTHIILVDRIYGDLWLFKPSNDEVQHVVFPKAYGAVHKAYYVDGKLLVETTGTPIQLAAIHFKRSVTPHLLLFNLKNFRNHE